MSLVVLFLGFAALAAVSLFWCFVRLERTEKAAVTVFLVLWILVLDSALYSDPNRVPNGLFHPGIGPDPDPTDTTLESAISFRLVDLVIPIALGARLYARGLPERVRWASIWLLAFFAWLVGGAVLGVLNGNAADLIAFELKVLVYLGVFGLVASVPITTFTEGRALRGLLYGSAAIAAVLVVMDGMNIRVGLDVPVVGVPAVGELGADAAGIFVALGAIALALAVVSDHGRFALFAAAAPLLLSPLMATQRAVILSLISTMTVFAIAAVVRRRPLKAKPMEFALFGTIILALAIGPPVARLGLGSHEATLPFQRSVESAFVSRAKEQSAETRVNQWRKAAELIEERPITGWGLGKTYLYFDAGHLEFFETNYTHNIGSDLLMRTGAIGLALFALAMFLAILDGLSAWRHRIDDVAASLALASVAIISGLLVRGMVESVFEKYRLATMLGLMLGIVGSVARAHASDRSEERLPATARTAWSSETYFAR